MAYPYISLVASPLKEEVCVAVAVRNLLLLLLLCREADADEDRVAVEAATVVINPNRTSREESAKKVQ